MHTQALVEAVVHDLNDLKAIDVNPLDVHVTTPVTDYMVIASGNSSRHVYSLAAHLVDNMKKRHCPTLSIQADSNNEWVLVDLGNVVVHIMQAPTRAFYNLDKLWAPVIPPTLHQAAAEASL